MAYLSCRELVLGYDSRPIVGPLSFSVEAGDYLCVVGENGAGKSTLTRTLLGLMKPISGAIETGDGLRGDEIGYLPQQTAIQSDFPATVWEIALSGCQSRLGRRCFYGKADRALAQRNLERMEMTAFKRRCFRELSGGQRQRVLLARALCATRKLLLLDEPAAGLDPRVTAGMYELIDRLNRERDGDDSRPPRPDGRDGVSIIMVSHDVAAAARRASHILHVGEPSFFGTVEAYRQSDIGRRFLSLKGGDAR